MSFLANLVTPHADEILHSFVSRLAAANGAPSVSHFRYHFQLGGENHLRSPAVLSKLSQLTGLSMEVLASHHINRQDGWALFRGQRMLHTSVNAHDLRYCPHCVAEDIASGRGRTEARPYVRATWVLATISACTKHGVIHKRPAEMNNTYRLDFSRYYRDHSDEIKAAADYTTKVTVPAHDIYFTSRLSGASTDAPLLDPLPFHVAARLCEIVGGISKFRPKVRKLDYGATTPWEVSCHGFEILRSWESFFDFLTTLNMQYANRSGLSYKGMALYGNLQQYLTDNLGVPELKTMIEMVRKHAMEALPIGPEDPFIGGGGERRWHTIHTASKANDVHPKLLRKALLEFGVLGPMSRERTDNRVFISVEDARKIAETIHDGIAIQDVRKRLGLQEHIVRDLMAKGILVPAFGDSTGLLRQFSRTAVDAMLDNIFANLEERQEDKVNRPIVKAIRHAGCTYADVIAAILEGKLKRRYLTHNRAKVGFERLLVDVSEVATVLLPERNHLTLKESEKVLKANDRTIRHLIDRGYISAEHVINPCTRLPQKLVRVGTLHAFEAEYISLARFAEGWVSAMKAKNILNRAGIHPTIQSEDKHVAFYYRRSQVLSLRP